MTRRQLCQFLLLSVLVGFKPGSSADLITLSPENWDEFAPDGEEVDAIYGDYVLRNDVIVAVVSNPDLVKGRSSSRSGTDFAGGSIIDLTQRHSPNDRMTAYLPGARRRGGGSQLDVARGDYRPDYAENFRPRQAKRLTFSLPIKPAYRQPLPVDVRYTIEDGWPYVLVEMIFRYPDSNRKDGGNQNQKAGEDEFDATLDKPADNQPERPEVAIPAKAPSPLPALPIECAARFVAFGNFEFGLDFADRLFWADDRWSDQSYGVLAEGHRMRYKLNKLGTWLHYAWPDKEVKRLKKGETFRMARRIFPARNLFDVKAIAAELIGEKLRPSRIRVRDASGPIENAVVLVKNKQGKNYATGKTGPEGTLDVRLPDGEYNLEVAPFGRMVQKFELKAGHPELNVSCEKAGRVRAKVVGGRGNPIPCKVEFRGIEGTADPFFFPDTGSSLVRNLIYTSDGKFDQILPPGKYQVIITRGPEYDAVYRNVEVALGRTSELSASLIRTTDTSGWISADLHNHSNISSHAPAAGGSSASQLGRVLNLLCEHIEFAPATEHNIIHSYEPLLEQLGAKAFLATCPGVGLTAGGRKYGYNDQNAFPFELKPHHLDGGAPQRPHHCAQIKWLASWGAEYDRKSPWSIAQQKVKYSGPEKLIQVLQPSNTFPPNVRPWIRAPLFVDADKDGVKERVRHLFAYNMDVLDVRSLLPLYDSSKFPRRDNGILDWLQMLEQGYRIPAAINSGATHNFHGSGGVRNYIRSNADEPSEIETLDVVRALKRGNSFMTTGPFLDAKVEGCGPGQTVRAPDGEVKLQIRIQCPNWIELERVRVLLNSKPSKKLDWSRTTHADRFFEDGDQFDASHSLKLQRDTYIIVYATGSGPNLRARKDENDAQAPHIAVTNPIYVDVDGNGFEPRSPIDDRVETGLAVIRHLSAKEGSRPCRVKMTLKNHSEKEEARGTAAIRFSPRGIARVIERDRLEYRIPAGKTSVMNLDIALDQDYLTEAALEEKKLPNSIGLHVLRSGKGLGLQPSRVTINIVDVGEGANLVLPAE